LIASRRHRYNAVHIYLATDSEVTLEQTKHFPEFTWMYTPSAWVGRKMLTGA
jgi:hypothetical protein